MPFGDFAVDRLKQITTLFGAETPSRWTLLRHSLLNSELHCVAEYRWGRQLAELRGGRRLAAFPLRVIDRVWHRWITHIHHCDIDRQARIGPGMLIMHRVGITIGPAVIGSNCVLHQNVTIGERVAGGLHGTPHIGENVWIGPGAILSGAITIGDGATISAGSVVSRDVPARSLVSGNPGRVIAQDYDNRAINSFVLPAAH